MEDCHEWGPTLDDGGGGTLEDDGMEGDDLWLGVGGLLSFDGEDNQAGGAMGVNNNSMQHTTATASSSTSSKTMASGQWGGLSVVAFIVNGVCCSLYFCTPHHNHKKS